GESSDTHPGNRAPGRKAAAHWGEERPLAPHTIVTRHAGGGRRQPGTGRALDGRMTVAAVDAQIGHVNLMVEEHGLNDALTLPSLIRGADPPHEKTRHAHESDDDRGQHETHADVCSS